MSAERWAIRKDYADENLKLQRAQRIEELETGVYESAAGIAQAVLAFHEVTPDQTEPPRAWVEQYGREAAMQRLTVAKSGYLPQSLAPTAINHAFKIMTGVARMRAFKQQHVQANLNVKLVLPAPTSREHPGPVVYQTKDLDE